MSFSVQGVIERQIKSGKIKDQEKCMLPVIYRNLLACDLEHGFKQCENCGWHSDIHVQRIKSLNVSGAKAFVNQRQIDIIMRRRDMEELRVASAFAYVED